MTVKRWCENPVNGGPWVVLESDYNALLADRDRLRGLLLECKRRHYHCEDSWYSCPKAEDGCSNASEGDECNCGADALNAKIDAALGAADQPAAALRDPDAELREFAGFLTAYLPELRAFEVPRMLDAIAAFRAAGNANIPPV